MGRQTRTRGPDDKEWSDPVAETDASNIVTARFVRGDDEEPEDRTVWILVFRRKGHGHLGTDGGPRSL